MVISKMKKNINLQSGQLAVLALFVGVIVLTIGLGVASRTTLDLKISRVEQESARVFNAAEAGVEELLTQAVLPLGTTTANVSDAGFSMSRTVTVTEQTEGVSLKKGQVVEVDVRTFIGPAVNVRCDPSAEVEVMKYVNLGSDYSVDRSFSSCNSTSAFGVLGGIKFLRVKLLGDTKVVVSAVGLGPQAYKISSQVQATVGDVRQVDVERTAPALPPIFDYVLFSGGAL